MAEKYPKKQPYNESDPSMKWGAQRRAEQSELWRNSPLAGWLSGGALIIVGLAFIARNVLDWELSTQWWAIFMLIPALSAMVTAWYFYQSDKPHLRQAALGSLLAGGFILIVAGAFFFDASWQLIWPLFPIMIGIGLILMRKLLTPPSS